VNGQSLAKAFLPLPAGGAAVDTATGLTYYRHSDWLAGGRLARTPTRTVYFDVAYGPYGESYAASGSVDVNFTGQNQDTVSGLYDFLFREYNTTHGRWPWPDPAGMAAVNMGNPQTWNRYAYVGNLPLTATDPLGLLSHWSDVVGTGRMSGVDPLLDPGGAWLASEVQQFMVEAGLNSPMQQGAMVYQAQVDCAFNPGSCTKGVPGTPGGPVLVPGGSTSCSYTTSAGDSGSCGVRTFGAFSVPGDVWNGYVAGAYQQLSQWWDAHSYYRLGLTEEDDAAYRLSGMISAEFTTFMTPCEYTQVTAQAAATLSLPELGPIPAGPLAGKPVLSYLLRALGVASLFGTCK